jgi:hypothetical protein
MDEKIIKEMVECFINADKPELITYLSYLLETAIDDDTYDDTECYDEDVQVEMDEDGFYSIS